MSVVGVDLGTLNTVIAVARNRGVDVVSHVLELSEPNLVMLTMPTDHKRSVKSSYTVRARTL